MQLKLIRFLQEELTIPASHIKLALDKIPQTPEQLLNDALAVWVD